MVLRVGLHPGDLPGNVTWEHLMHQVEIRIERHLDKRWVDWLGAFSITHTEQNQTLLTGSVQDQAALYGLIAKLRDLGVKLVSVNYRGQRSGENSW
jgi:hypothetical protein